MTTNTMTLLTAETITSQQIRDLRAESRRAEDADMAAVCDRALSIEIDDDDDAISEALHGRLRTMTEREAQQICADAINRARAQEKL